MKINKLWLHNFRNFEDVTFEFLAPFTVVIGENGQGKSSLLQGLRLAAAAFFMGLDEPERLHIQKEDIRRIDTGKRFAPQNDCFFEAEGIVAGTPCRWRRTLKKENGRTDSKDAAGIITLAENLNRQINQELKEDIDLPVIAFFSTARLWVEPKQTIQLKKKGSKLKDGYTRCLDVKSDKISSLEWIKSNYYKQLSGKTNGDLLKAVLEAVSTCVPGWSNLEWEEDYDDLAGTFTDGDNQGKFIPLYYLSDGQRTMASMVAEIAYRCVTLNEHLGRDAVKNSTGIVLIDEIDMHLHPNWQRTVVQDLKKAFPNIQFVATTHSPFIVQSLEAKELINLDATSDMGLNPVDMPLNQVATEIMQVENLQSDNFEERFAKAKAAFKTLQTGGKILKMADYTSLKGIIDGLVVTDTEDPVYKAYLMTKNG